MEEQFAESVSVVFAVLPFSALKLSARTCFATSAARFPRFIGQCKIDLAFESIDPADENAELVTDSKPLARASADKPALGRIIYIEVAGKRRNVDQTTHHHFG